MIGLCQFKYYANQESQYAYSFILNSDRNVPVDYTAMPHAIFRCPLITVVGF